MLTLLSIAGFLTVAMWVAHVGLVASHVGFRMPSGEISLCGDERAGKFPCWAGDGEVLETTMSFAAYEELEAHALVQREALAGVNREPGKGGATPRDPDAIVKTMRANGAANGWELFTYEVRRDGVYLVFRARPAWPCTASSHFDGDGSAENEPCERSSGHQGHPSQQAQ